MSPSSAATTTSSPRRATGSGRARSRIACAGHPAVQLAAAVGKPDPVRTEIVKAYVVLRPGFAPSRGAGRRYPRLGEDAAFDARISARGGVRRRLPLTTTRQGHPPRSLRAEGAPPKSDSGASSRRYCGGASDRILSRSIRAMLRVLRYR